MSILAVFKSLIGSLSKHDGDVLAWKMNFSHHFLVRPSQEQFPSHKSFINLTSHNHVLYKTWKMLIPRCFAEDGGETNQIVFCTCSFVVLFINAIVWWRPT